MRPLFGSVFGTFLSYKQTKKSSQSSTARHISSFDPHSDVFPLQSIPDNGGIELGGPNAQGGVTKSCRSKMESGSVTDYETTRETSREG